jgi:two-component system, OmpR family, response regulator
MEGKPHIMVVDDHRDIRELVGKYLSKNGFRTTTAEDARSARVVLAAAAIDLVVLDIMMPGEDGLSLCRYLRESTEIPVILLTAMAEETDRIVGLEIGADDYLTKPFNPRELLARIRSVLRRARALPPSREPRASAVYRFESWSLDPARRELTGGDGVAVPLSTGEFRLLVAFLERPGVVLTRDQLLDITRGREAIPFDRSIDNQVSRLRRKIEADPRTPVLIKTVWGGGYSFAGEVSRE